MLGFLVSKLLYKSIPRTVFKDNPLLKTIEDEEMMSKVTKGKVLSVSQGILAKAFEVNAEHWHTAIADVEMLMGVLYEVSKYIQERGDVDIRTAYVKSLPKSKRRGKRK